MALLDDIRSACSRVASAARSVSIAEARLASYAEALLPPPPATGLGVGPGPETSAEDRAAFVLTLDAVNFGSGWFPTLRKRDGMSGFNTVAAGLADRFAAFGPWSPGELRALGPADLAGVLDQDPAHELMAAYAGALNALGENVRDQGFLGVVHDAGTSAEHLVEELAAWPSFYDVSEHDGVTVPFFKRAQIAAADLQRAGVADFGDLERLTLFADNLVPHVLRLDGVLSFEPGLVARIEAGELIEHGSPEEVEIRACALHAVELLEAERDDLSAAAIDSILWDRGAGARYKARPRHRTRCTAY